MYQKTDENKKIEMGQALGKCMKKQDSTPAVGPPKEKLAIEPGTSNLQVTLQSEIAVTPKQNAPPAIVPFEPNFEDDGDIPDLALLSAICDIESSQQVGQVPVKTTVANTSKVFNQIPWNFFANCQLGMINVNLVQEWLHCINLHKFEKQTLIYLILKM